MKNISKDVEQLEGSLLLEMQKWTNHFGRVWQFLKMLNVHLPCDPAIPFQCIYTKEKSKHMFIQNLCMNIHRSFICNSQPLPKKI